jgi:hypothetical protein
VNDRPPRRFSQAISEGDGISVLASVSSGTDAADAAAAGADAIVVRGNIDRLEGVELPVLSFANDVADTADAVAVASAELDDDDLATRYQAVVERGQECVVEVRSEEQLERVLELLDPEILLLASDEDAAGKLDAVLDLLPDVPAGKLVVADVGAADGEGVAGLERVGIDAVIVAASDVATLVGDEPPSS